MKIIDRNIPKPIQRYLETYPLFATSHDINQSLVKTSPESFFYAIKMILDSLEPNTIVWSTDNLSLHSSNFFSNYWFESGLDYLRANYKATSKGIQISRIFIVHKEEYEKYKVDIDLIAALHARAGVRVYLTIYENLPSDMRYYFAIFGNHFVDEVIYDIGVNIVDNIIHWSDNKVQKFNDIMRSIRNHIKMQLAVSVKREIDISGISRYAQRVKQSLKPVLEQRGRCLNPKDQPIKIKILLISANPTDTGRLRLGQEFRNIDQAVRQSEFRDAFQIEQQNAVRVADIQSHLLRCQPDIVHFSGHGSKSNEIIIEDNNGHAHPISIKALGKLFAVLHDNIKCVILNACYSEGQAKAIAEHIDCVIGMSKAIGDTAAITFAVAFYQALGYGRDIKTAYDLGCVQIDLENLKEQDTPKLIAQSIDPASIKFINY